MSINSSITILFKGGRLPSWHRLSQKEKGDFEQRHVDLMLAVASQYQMRRLEGFRLIAPQGDWERFWLIEFPTFPGVEAWVKAEMAPPYGRYGYYDYEMARQILPEADRRWLSKAANQVTPMAEDPHTIPSLTIDNDSVVVFLFMKGERIELPDTGNRSEREQIATLANRFGATRLEQFQLIAPKGDWDRVWLVELPVLAEAEAFIEAEANSGRCDDIERDFVLTRKWAPAYFAAWIPR